jgi:hypothetical protein
MTNFVDLTKITTPFGLLDTETQEALKAHGGPYESYDLSWVWRAVGEPSWQKHLAYRVKPAPPKPRECWSYGAHIRDTEAEAIAFRQAVADANPGMGYEKGPITKWIEVLP